VHHEHPAHPKPINLHPAPVEPVHTLNVAPEPLPAPPKGSVHLPGEEDAEEIKEDVKGEAKHVKNEAKKKGEQIEKKSKDLAKKAKVCGLSSLE
jgi:hypothetical protein